VGGSFSVKSKEGRPILTYVVIAVSALVMLHETVLPASASSLLYDEYALSPSYITHGMRIISIVSYMFLHADWVHLILDSFALWGVGTIMEKEIGSARFGIVFLASGVIAGLSHVVLNPSSTIALVGASGAVFGALATLFLLSPFKKTTIFVVPVPAIIIGVLMVSVELASFVWASGMLAANDVQVIGFVTGAVLSFWIDAKRALKWLAIGAGVAIIIYMLGMYLGVI
jgi:membrane associated rhomboid family serine protease